MQKDQTSPGNYFSASRRMRSKSRTSVSGDLYSNQVWLPTLFRASFYIAPTCMYVLGIGQRLWKPMKEFPLLPSKGGG